MLKPAEPFSFNFYLNFSFEKVGIRKNNRRILKEWFCKNWPSPEWQTIAVIPKRQLKVSDDYYIKTTSITLFIFWLMQVVKVLLLTLIKNSIWPKKQKYDVGSVFRLLLIRVILHVRIYAYFGWSEVVYWSFSRNLNLRKNKIIIFFSTHCYQIKLWEESVGLDRP